MVVEKDGQGGISGRGPKKAEVTIGSANKGRESAPRMVPLFSRRSVIVLCIGLAIGIIGGLVYYLISPSLNSAEPTVLEDTTPMMWGDYKGPFESTVQIQIVNPGSSYASLTDLRRTAEYYAAKANTFTFLDFLAEELEESAPEYSHTAEELDQMVSVRYNSNSEVPLVEITTIGATMEETLYLTGFVPSVFKGFLAAEEDKLRLEEYEFLVEDIDNVMQILLEAEQELADLSLESATSSIDNDPTYIALAAKVTALETQLSRQAENLATLIATGDSSENYVDAVKSVERTSEALAEAKSELAILRAQSDIDYTGQNLDYQIAEARVDNLISELAELTDRITSLLTGNGDEPTALEYIVVGKPSSPVPSIDRIRGRDAILLGSILGVGVAWVTLNFKWLAKGMPSSNVAKREEGEEEETA
ncbi:MAG TPA: hypothetical protein G4O18_03615 [Dehalococcoidia bacterium]|nr:hypothetical protein [Dehalococcoidia bacterium]